MTRGSELANILFVAGVLLLLVLFAIGVISLQLCFYACYRRRAAQASSSSPQSPRRQRRGGVTTVVAGGGNDHPTEAPRSLPATAVYRAAARPAEEECAVCLAGLKDGDEVRLMPCCGHEFHALCVDTWLAAHATCPLCRIAVARPGMAPASALSPVPSASDDQIPVIVIQIPELAGDHPKRCGQVSSGASKG